MPQVFIIFPKFSQWIPQDIWALGVTLWELYSLGENPYSGMSNVEIVEKVVGGYRLPRPYLCPYKLYEMMCSCWEENPEKRPNIKEIFKILEENTISTLVVIPMRFNTDSLYGISTDGEDDIEFYKMESSVENSETS